MVQLHFDRNAVTCKIVYYGPGLSGKTTNLEIIHKKAPEDSRGDMVSIATRGDRTLYFDYLPLELGQVQGMDTTFQLYTVPGQIYYNNTRKLVLQGVDGVVFVADSSASKLEENRESFRNLLENLQAIGLSINDIPVVIQYNKRDLPDALPINELDAQLNSRRLTTFEAVAKDGQGVFVTLKEIGRQVIERINTNQAGPRRRTGNAVPKDVAKRSSAPLPTAKPSAPTPANTAASQAATTPKPPTASKSTGPLGGFPTPVGSRQTPTKRMGNEQPTRQINNPPPAFQQSASRNAPTEPSNQTGSDSSKSRRAVSNSGKKTSVNLENHEGNPRERHLNKAKPPSLSQRRTHQLKDMNDLGSTEPHLKKYRNEGGGGSRFMRFIVGLFLALLSIVIIGGVLVVFVPQVNKVVVPYLPAGLQKTLSFDNNPAGDVSAPATPEAPSPSQSNDPEGTPAGDPETTSGE